MKLDPGTGTLGGFALAIMAILRIDDRRLDTNTPEKVGSADERIRGWYDLADGTDVSDLVYPDGTTFDSFAVFAEEKNLNFLNIAVCKITGTKIVEFGFGDDPPQAIFVFGKDDSLIWGVGGLASTGGGHIFMSDKNYPDVVKNIRESFREE